MIKNKKMIKNKIIKVSYQYALKKVIAMHLQRKKVYGDDWKKSPDWELLALIKQKECRLEKFIIYNSDEKIYENRVDTLIDLINYSLFLLENALQKNRVIHE